MSRFFARVALNAGIWVWLTGAVPADEPKPDTTARPLPTVGQSKILAALDQPTEFDFQQRPLSEVMNHFARKHQIEIHLDGKAIHDAGLDDDTSITETLKKISLRSALKLLLRPLGLTYFTGDDYLLITSRGTSTSKRSFKVYPVEDLVALDSPFRPSLPKSGDGDDSPIQREVLKFPGFGGFGGTPGNPGTAGQRDEAGDFTSLIDVITSTVAPTEWDEVGGPGSITGNGNTQAIAISQTDEVHEEIVALLAALRRVRDEQLAAAKPIETAPPEATETNTRLQVRAYRLMRGTGVPNKSSWRPVVSSVGDARPPRRKQTGGQAKQAAKPSAAGNDASSANDAEPAAPRADQADGDNDDGVDNSLESLAETIARLVPTMIDTESWKPSGAGVIVAVGEGVVIRNTAQVQRRVATLMIELLPDCVPMGFTGPWGPWNVAAPTGPAAARLRLAAADPWPCQAEPRANSAECILREILLEKCDVQFDAIPLIDALRPLVKPREVQVCIDHKALEHAGVDVGAPITCSLRGVRYKSALKLLLDELDLVYVIRDEVLLITTKSETENMLTCKVYPVFDLVAPPAGVPLVKPGLEFQPLIDAIMSNISPTTWDEVGGPGAIREFVNSGALVISQTAEVHEELAEYLRALREARAARVRVK